MAAGALWAEFKDLDDRPTKDSAMRASDADSFTVEFLNFLVKD
jgi:hypothetical protein